jgi:flavin reductase (DIM6/NTAB) family NADH-FMN oxidoreductase RutF
MKKEVGSKNYLCPVPVTIVGAVVNGKPNFITIGFIGVMDYSHVSIASARNHYTNAGIKENGTFSVNIPSTGLVKETDYCGIVSGKKVDKSAVFETFYGELETAPMIAECPINMECRLVQTLDMPHHDVFIGEIVKTYCDEEVLTDGGVDFEKVDPILFIIYGSDYWRFGKPFARGWSVGKELMKE